MEISITNIFKLVFVYLSMKKEKFILSLMTMLLSIQITLAQNPLIDNSFQSLGNAIRSIFAPIFGVSVLSEFLFAKILFFFLLFSVVYI